jgi:Ni/Co efflux regulator RcnB
MPERNRFLRQGTALFVAIAMSCPMASAEKPAWAGEGKGRADDARESKGGHRNQTSGRPPEGVERAGSRANAPDDGRRPSTATQRVFDDRRRVIVRDYYVSEYRTGHCPPGLAKKHNGCMPPGQAKQWQIGRPLPREVVYYELPPALVVQLGTPPSGYRYVRVASDILMIAIGTGLVLEAISDLGRM